MKAIGYIRISKGDAGSLGLEAQRRTIREECKRRGWELLAVYEDAGYSARDLERPGITATLKALKDGVGEALVVAKLDRLSRSVHDFSEVMERGAREKWKVVVLDLGVDTTTPAGEVMANVLAAFAQFERSMIVQRTQEGLAVAKSNGVKLGRRPSIDPKLRKRIIRERSNGATYPQIAERLTAEGIPTARNGKRWYPSTVRSAIPVDQRVPA